MLAQLACFANGIWDHTITRFHVPHSHTHLWHQQWPCHPLTLADGCEGRTLKALSDLSVATDSCLTGANGSVGFRHDVTVLWRYFTHSALSDQSGNRGSSSLRYFHSTPDWGTSFVSVCFTESGGLRHPCEMTPGRDVSLLGESWWAGEDLRHTSGFNIHLSHLSESWLISELILTPG